MMGISFVYPQYLWLGLLIPVVIFLALFGRKIKDRVRLWIGISLRSILLAFIIFALAGLQVHLPSRTLTAVFLLDVSDSISPAEQARGEEFIRQAVESMPSGDRSAIVVFGEDALVERLASEDSSLAKLSSIPVTTRTDIASALQLGMALFPAEGARRLVLLSDGRENISLAMKQAELASFQEIELQYFALGDFQNQTEVLVSALEAPSGMREGQDFDLGITVESTTPVGATLRVFAEDELIHTQEVNLQSGVNRFEISISNPDAGFRRFRAQIIPDSDSRLQNNEASAYTVVYGPPSILLVEGSPGEGENLARALEGANMRITVVAPDQIPATLPELARYDTVILANVPAAGLPAGTMEALPVYVRDLGKGLLMTGGDNSFGAGGYLRTPLETAMPVYMDVKSRELAANLALIVAVDKSGSMGRCHCDNPDLNQSYTAVETGQPKVDIAKEAIMRSSSALGDQDYLGVLTFDQTAHWALAPRQLPDQSVLENAIGSFQAEGQTNMYAGVNEAYKAIKNLDAKRKHIILMTDGWVRTGDLLPIAKEMQENGVTLSVIAAGEGSAEYLKALSEAGGGRYYPAVDMMSVPDIFLKETVKSIGQYVIEEPFYPLPASPSPILRGIDETQLPGLFGYNGTSPKNSARLDLLTPRGDPLLASWQYGLGRASAWTSDLKGRWATDWVQWRDFARFSSQLVGWLIPSPHVEGFDARTRMSDQGIQIQLSASDQENQPYNFLEVQARIIDPRLQTTEVRLTQVGPGLYEVITPARQPGAYLVWLGIRNQDEPVGQMTMGMVVPYSPEYRIGGINHGLLEQLARVTGGSVLAEPGQAFIHNLPAMNTAREIWHILLLIVAILFPVDIAIRRLVITKRDVNHARSWAAKFLKKSSTVPKQVEPAIFHALFHARDRVRSKKILPLDLNKPVDQDNRPLKNMGSDQIPAVPQDQPAETSHDQPPDSNPQDQPPMDSLSRLREAKKRAKR